MTLINCPACGKEISNEAASCSNCGHPVAKPQKARSSRLGVGCLTVIGILIVIGIIGSMADKNGGSTSLSGQSDSSCKTDWARCSDNAYMANHYSRWTDIQAACQTAATDQARYGTPKWPWLAFGSFLKGGGYATSGVAVLIEPDAQFQNGFGAMVHSRVVCTYDLRASHVLNVSISER